jgi:DNA-binding NarL/FixJ family response regulator
VGSERGDPDSGPGRLLRFSAGTIPLTVNLVQGGFARDSFRASINLRKSEKNFRNSGRNAVLRILIVEDDSQLAITLKYLVEDNPRYRVVGTADDADTAIAAAEEHDPDLVLLDLHLAHGTSGFSVAVRLNDLGVPCLFVSGKAPRFPMPDLALGCLMKPFTAEDVHRSLAMSEDLLRGRETLRPKIPDNLTLYEPLEEEIQIEPGFIPSKPSLRTRLEHWISGQTTPQH